ncbi:MAG: glycosyl transferase group 1, partial [Frankiales bacterium]|nr:glycosyl transferase group 1 [Frankiales bacterium]
MRVVLDGTPLMGQRTGVGRYVAGLVAGLAALPDPPDLALAGLSLRGVRPASAVPWTGRRRVPAAALHALWRRGTFPPGEWVVGAGADVFHATNFRLPPLRHTAGVVTVHDLSFLLHPGTVTPDVLRFRVDVPRSVARARAIVTDAASVRQELVEHLGIDPRRVHSVPLGVGPEWLTTPVPSADELRSAGLPPRYLLFVGTAEPRKDLATLLAAHRSLPDAPPVVLAGPAGWGARPAGAEHAVRLGFVSEATLRTAVAGATALVLPSRYEGFGLPVLEALACGTPVVCSDLPPLREVAGDQAAYAPAGDPDAFAAALQEVLSGDGGP